MELLFSEAHPDQAWAIRNVSLLSDVPDVAMWGAKTADLPRRPGRMEVWPFGPGEIATLNFREWMFHALG